MKSLEANISGYISGYKASSELLPLPNLTPTIEASELMLPDKLLVLVSGANTTSVVYS